MVKAWLTPNSRTAINVPFQHGKQLSSSTPVWTEQGWKKHGDLEVGDYVFAPNGAPVRVQAVSEEGINDCKITFSDGSVIECHERHEWIVYDRNKHGWRVYETQEIEARKLKDKTRFILSVPRPRPLIMADNRDLRIHPYALGAWLGDGHSRNFNIAHSAEDHEVVTGIIACGYPCTSQYVQESTNVWYTKFKCLNQALKSYNLIGNKHIPDDYFLTSDEQRLDLLAGLIDTDGNYSSGRGAGQYRFTNTNKRLVKQVAFLARTLGFKVGVQCYPASVSSSGVVGRKKVYVIAFSPVRSIPCRIPRKQTNSLSESCRIGIVSVERCEPKPGKCIQVEGGLYLAGSHLTPTHNSVLGSVYFPAWVLLRWPETRVGLASYEESYASNFGAKVRDVVKQFGPSVGINLRDDTAAKGEWAIDKYGGGMICKGRGGALVGRPIDLLILDDLIKNAEEAQSPTILDGIWDWYCTVGYSRLGPTAPVVAIGTRWGPKDIFGRMYEEGKIGGDKFDVVNIKALAGENDILGRKPGEALWPQRVPQERLEKVQLTRPRWFKACYQGEPEEVAGLHFQPRMWPTYTDVGDAWRYKGPLQWYGYRKLESTIIHAVDWAQAGKKRSNKTAITTAAFVEDGKMLVLNVFNKPVRYEENAPALAEICRRYGTFGGQRMYQIVAGDDDMLSDAMVVECRRYGEIPEIRRLGIRSRSKIVRAQAGIIRSQNGLFLMPSPAEPWFEMVADQLSAFTGEEGAEDDIADTFGILGRLGDEFKPFEEDDGMDDPALGAAGYESDIW